MDFYRLSERNMANVDLPHYDIGYFKLHPVNPYSQYSVELNAKSVLAFSHKCKMCVQQYSIRCREQLTLLRFSSTSYGG